MHRNASYYLMDYFCWSLPPKAAWICSALGPRHQARGSLGFVLARFKEPCASLERVLFLTYTGSVTCLYFAMVDFYSSFCLIYFMGNTFTGCSYLLQEAFYQSCCLNKFASGHFCFLYRVGRMWGLFHLRWIQANEFSQ